MGHVTVSLRADPDGSVRVNRGARPASTVYGPRQPEKPEPVRDRLTETHRHDILRLRGDVG